MMQREVEVLVVGAGIAGLAAASDLASQGVTPLVVDVGERPGGVMQTDAIGGYRVETGPNSFQMKPGLHAFAKRHGLMGLLCQASPESRRRSLLRGGRLVALPHGPLSAVTTPLVSTAAKLRLLAEPFIRAGNATGESVYEFVARRLGAEVATELVGAFLTGVYAGDERELGIEAVFPALVRLEREHGSIVRGGLAGLLGRGPVDPEGAGLPGSWACNDGLGSVSDALAAALPETPMLRTRVESLVRDGKDWRVEAQGADESVLIRARCILIATPAFAAADLLAAVDGDAARALAGIDYAPIAALGLGVRPENAREPLEGFGFLVPRSAERKLLGCLFMSRLFPGRAPAGSEMLHAMFGGQRWREAADAPDDVLIAQAQTDLDVSLGLKQSPEVLAIQRWPRAIPQPGREHVREIEALERRVAALPGLLLAGGYLAGISVADSLMTGVRAARRILAERMPARAPI